MWMYMVVSSETGVSWGLAATALLQHAELQRHFLGASVNRGNRRGCWVLLPGDGTLVCCLSSTAPGILTGIALFFYPPDINTSTLNMHAHPLMFMFLSWRHGGLGGLAHFLTSAATERKRPYFRNPQMLLLAKKKKKKNVLHLLCFFKWNSERASVFANVQAAP